MQRKTKPAVTPCPTGITLSFPFLPVLPLPPSTPDTFMLPFAGVSIPWRNLRNDDAAKRCAFFTWRGENLLAATFTIYIDSPYLPLLHTFPSLSSLLWLPAQLVIFLVATLSKRKLIKSNSCVGSRQRQRCWLRLRCQRRCLRGRQGSLII